MGYIHSIESFGTVDGPGIRFVVFFQGCPMRCLYCHNPDTWKTGAGMQMSAEDILSRMERKRVFYSTGGITATGGEPMLQMEFLIELFTKAKERGIHTCLDTSGIVFVPNPDSKIYAQTQQLMQITDLVMLDIKHMDPRGHKELTGHSGEPALAFAEYLNEIHKQVWIRHVVVPGITDDVEGLRALGNYLKTLDNVEKLEVLPYHNLGVSKYENLGMTYPLKDTPQLTKDQAKAAEAVIRKAWGRE